MTQQPPPSIRFDQLKGTYQLDVSDNPEVPSLIAILGRGSLAADASVVLVVKLDQPADSSFEVFLGTDRADRCPLGHGQTVSLFIALKSGGWMPTSGITTVRFRLQGSSSGGRAIDIASTIKARLITHELRPPEIRANFESEVAFGVTHGSAAAPAAVIIATVTPSLPPMVATYDGPPADLVLQTVAALITPEAVLEALPVRVGTRPVGRTSSDEVSWSQGSRDQAWQSAPDAAMRLRRTVPFPFDQEPVEIVLGVAARDAIEIARRVSGENELAAEIELALSLTLVNGDKAEVLLQQHRRITARFTIASLLTVASHDLDPVALALTRDPQVAPIKAGGPISRRINMRSESANRTSSLELTYGLTLEAFAEARDPRLDAEFTVIYGGHNFEFPTLAIIGHELRHGEPINVPLREILEASILKSQQKRSHVPRRGDLVVSFRFFEFEGSPDPLFARLSIPVEIEMIPPDLVACIDLGTSATSIWFGPVEGPNTGAVLPLGDVVYAISRDEHEEYESGLGIDNVLLPSLVGLSSHRNLRAKLDPLSLGEIGLTVGGEVGAERRLRALGRRYDISVPFVPRQDIPAHRDTIVFHPKRSLIAAAARPPAVRALEMTGGKFNSVGHVDIQGLIIDVFDELGAYLVPRALTHFDRDRSVRRGSALTDMWLDAKQPIGAIVTHPSGVSIQSRQAYVEAGRRFLARFTGQPVDPTGVQDTSHLWVKLVPEAIAAINYGIGYLRKNDRLPPGKHVLAALDIGAGTYDATLVEAEIGSGGLENWTVLSHFGVTVGGLDLDRAIADKVANVLRDAFRNPEVKNGLILDLDPPTGASVTQRFAREIAFQDEVQLAKKRLTTALFDMPESSGYVWTAASDIPFEVVVGREPDKETLPVRRKQSGRLVSPQRILVDTVGPTSLVIRTNKRDGAVEIVLQIGPGHFATNEAEPIDALSPATVARFLGTVLPRMVLREVARLKMKPPTWVVTGRTALWPPLYAAIGAVAAGVPGSHMAAARPFRPSEMKVAVINGALALAINPHLSLGNDVLNPLAVISMGAEAQTADPRRPSFGRVTRIAGIRYLTGSDKLAGSDEVICSGRCELVRAVPGLSESASNDKPDKEALEMFDAFAVPPYERLVSDIAQTGPSEMRRKLKVTWTPGDRSTSVTIDPGDGRPQRFDVPNRDSRIYHD
jgi:hypothetical protein